MGHLTDPLPPWARAGRAAALAAFDRGDDGAAVARLTSETVPTAVTHRSVDEGRHGMVVAALRFEHEDLIVHLRVHVDGRLRTVTGLVFGEYDHALLRLRRPDSHESLYVGEDGGFTVSGLAKGPLSLSLHRSGRPPMITEWFTV